MIGPLEDVALREPQAHDNERRPAAWLLTLGRFADVIKRLLYVINRANLLVSLHLFALI